MLHRRPKRSFRLGRVAPLRICCVANAGATSPRFPMEFDRHMNQRPARPEVRVSSQRALAAGELDAFCALIRKGDEVDEAGLSARVRRADALASLRVGDRMVGVAARKNPEPSYRQRAFEKAGVGLDPAGFTHEIGWVFVDEDQRGKHSSRRLVAALLEELAGRQYATSRASNAAMHGTLRYFGFEAVGRPFPSVRHPEQDVSCLCESRAPALPSTGSRGGSHSSVGRYPNAFTFLSLPWMRPPSPRTWARSWRVSLAGLHDARSWYVSHRRPPRCAPANLGGARRGRILCAPSAVGRRRLFAIPFSLPKGVSRRGHREPDCQSRHEPQDSGGQGLSVRARDTDKSG